MSMTGDEAQIILLSLKVALVGVLASLPIAIALAYLLARREFPGKILLDAIVHLPLVLPPVVVGFVLLLLFGRRGVLGEWLEHWFGIVLAFRWTGAALASAIMILSSLSWSSNASAASSAERTAPVTASRPPMIQGASPSGRNGPR